MSSKTNTRIVLQSRPKGPIEPDTFKTDRSERVPTEKDLKDGEVVVRVMWISLDASMTTWLKEFRNYLPPVKLGAVMRASAVGKIVASKCPNRKVGQSVEGTFGWQEYWTGPSKHTEALKAFEGSTERDYVGPLGTSGLTAYFGLKDIGKIKNGDTVVISGAAGSVGIIVTQLALLLNPKGRVITTAGSPAKCKQLKEMGCHAAINYKDKDWRKQLGAAMKDEDKSGKKGNGWADVYFDNVGGEMLDFMLGRLNEFARIVMCGAISDYNSAQPYPIRNYQALISTKSTMQGFIVFQFAERYDEGREYLSKLLKDGKLKYEWTVVGDGKDKLKGVEACVDGLQGLYEGRNVGKTVVKVWDGNMSEYQNDSKKRESKL
ncbi:hypothetical protein HD553DRAFT_67402 [Filobasidium floriforme]|uniref:uncharacterized protein n=1 Tax=Filobasidium floriforme TaxID=5210 RepID=UPI001E8E1B6B|nr:uncharacterized protein HD553DRAFT_67402 [Filobasidium floriforme]KAH8082201.1 hypothetical protein HD553DRAFT_67402 [Filobasidium floriforme]